MSPRPNAQWLALRWHFQAKTQNGKPDFWPQRGGYPHNIWAREDLSGAAYFAYAFGTLNPEYQPGLLGIYNRFYAAADAAKGAPFDTVGVYPQNSVLAFINWPLGMAPGNPDNKWPHAVCDRKWGFYAWRNRWLDENDVVISILTKTAKGYMEAKGESTLSIHGAGNKKTTWGTIKGFTGEFKPAPDGTTVLVTGDGSSLAIDFSKKSGADAMLVMTGPGAPGGKSVTAGGQTFSFLFPGTDPSSEPQAAGAKVIVGGQTVSFDGTRIVLGP